MIPSVAATFGKKNSVAGNTTVGRIGFSLVETLVFMSVAAILFSVATTAVFRMNHLQQATESETKLIRGVLALSAAFHDDFDTCISAQKSDPNNSGESSAGLVLRHSNDTSVDYLLDGSVVLRIVRSQQRLVSQDQFRLPSNVTVTFDLDSENGRQRAGLTLIVDPMVAADHTGREVKIAAIRRLPNEQEQHP